MVVSHAPGEAGIPYGLIGYATDYANGVMEEDTDPDDLMALIGASKGVLASTLAAATAALADAEPPAAVGHQIIMG